MSFGLKRQLEDFEPTEERYQLLPDSRFRGVAEGDEACDDYYGDEQNNRWNVLWRAMVQAACCCCGRYLCVKLTKSEKMSLEALRKRASVMYNRDDPSHEALLHRYWQMSFPGEAASAPDSSPHWKRAGFQSSNPRTDFRGGGLLSLQSMTYFSETYPNMFREIVFEAGGCGDYPFSAGFVNICYMIVLYFRLNVEPGIFIGGDETASSKCLKAFASLAQDPDAHAFEELFSVCCIKLHRTWRRLSRREGASLMDFPEALRLTKKGMISLLSRQPQSVDEFHYLYEPISLPRRSCD